MAKRIVQSDSPAYPTHGYSTGMDMFTAISVEAMKGILAGSKHSVPLSVNECNAVADSAIMMAETLLKKLNGEK